MKSISIIIPAKNEESGLAEILPKLRKQWPGAEIIIVNDGSSDNTSNISHSNGARLVTHPYSMGNGAAVKSGARAATGDILVFMDADGQHDPDDIPRYYRNIMKVMTWLSGRVTVVHRQAWAGLLRIESTTG